MSLLLRWDKQTMPAVTDVLCDVARWPCGSTAERNHAWAVLLCGGLLADAVSRGCQRDKAIHSPCKKGAVFPTLSQMKAMKMMSTAGRQNSVMPAHMRVSSDCCTCSPAWLLCTVII